MMGFGKIGLAAIVAGLLTACVSAPPDYNGNQTVTIEYDPYDYDPADLLAEAQSHCSAYGMTAVFEDETSDPQSVRWRYRHYRCV